MIKKMSLNIFDKKIDKNKFQVFLCTCPSGLPLSFARHPWFVVNKKGELARYEVFWRPQKWDKRNGHIHKDFYPPFQGIPIFPFSEKYFWKQIKIHGFIESFNEIEIKNIIECIESSMKEYPFVHTYSFFGPNSNTYAQWIIDKFPETNFKLPWNSFGK